MKPADGDRLRDIDPEFARLVSALRSGSPSRDALARTIDAVESAATPAPVVRTASRPTNTGLFALGAGAIALVLVAGAYNWTRSSANAPVTQAPVVAAAARADTPSGSDVPTASVRVEDLPPASVAEQVASPALPSPALPSPALPSPAPLPKAASTPKPLPSITPARPTPAAGPSAGDFRDELALVERVRTQLSNGDSAACLRSIDEYGQRFSGGAFVQEVEVMRIEALAASGDHERARAFGGKFLSEHPTSPYAGRVRSVLEKSK